MIEVIKKGDGWTWHMICNQGRVLAYTDERWPSDIEAAAAAKRYRTTLWAIAEGIDNRQARAI